MMRERPDAVVCTHAFPCGAMAEYKNEFADAPPVVAIVTDFAVHGFWVHKNIDRYVVATEAMRNALASAARGPRCDFCQRHPGAAASSRSRRIKGRLRERLDLPRDRHVVLLMGGGLGIAPVERMLSALKSVRAPLAAAVLAGKNARMGRRLAETAETVNFPVRALPFIENVYDYMHAADVLVTKPGGLTHGRGVGGAGSVGALQTIARPRRAQCTRSG